MVDGKALVDSVKKEIIDPGIQRLMETPYFTEMRRGKRFPLKGSKGGRSNIICTIRRS